MTQNFTFANIDNSNDDFVLVVTDLEKKVRSIYRAHTLYCKSIFEKMSSANMQNAKIFYEFLITEHKSSECQI